MEREIGIQKEEGQVTKQMDSLQKEITNLNDALTALQTVLDPVLLPSKPEPEKTEARVDAPMVPLAEKIMHANDRIAKLRDDVLSLSHRVQL